MRTMDATDWLQPPKEFTHRLGRQVGCIVYWVSSQLRRIEMR